MHLCAVGKLRVAVGAPEALDHRRPGRDLGKHHRGGDVHACLDRLGGDHDAAVLIPVTGADHLAHLPLAIGRAEAGVDEGQARRRLEQLRQPLLER